MAVNAYGDNIATNGVVPTNQYEVENKTALGKDDFMTLLLVELQHQDPTEPMDSDKILTQTSQLAGLEASENTNKALSDLATSLASTQEFSTIAAIGKMADTGSDAIAHDEGATSSFEIYFPEDIKNGTVDIVDGNDNVVATLNIAIDEDEGQRDSGVYEFSWNGITSQGDSADSGIYSIKSNYTDTTGASQTTRLGAYPIESVRFEGGKALVKLGSAYVPLEQIREVY